MILVKNMDGIVDSATICFNEKCKLFNSLVENPRTFSQKIREIFIICYICISGGRVIVVMLVCGQGEEGSLEEEEHQRDQEPQVHPALL